jgi:hypothetical protein
VRLLLLQARGTDEPDTSALADRDEAMEDVDITSVL